MACIPQPLDLQAKNLAKEVELWIANFEDYVSLAAEKFSDDKKKSLLLTCAGLPVRRIVEGLPMEEKLDPYAALKKALLNYFCPSQSTVFHRYQFRSRVQEVGENLSAYVAQLRTLANSCDFNDTQCDTVHNQSIRDQFIVGMVSPEIRKRLITEEKLSLKRALDIAIAMESANEQVKLINPAIKSDEPISGCDKMTLAASNVKCYACGKIGHFARDCRTKSNSMKTKVQCNTCRKFGHIAADCWSMANKKDKGLFSNVCLTVNRPRNELRYMKGTFLGVPFKGLIDTGSTVSIINRHFVKSNQLEDFLMETKRMITVADGRQKLLTQK